jgi:hypothetical protein
MTAQIDLCFSFRGQSRNNKGPATVSARFALEVIEDVFESNKTR